MGRTPREFLYHSGIDSPNDLDGQHPPIHSGHAFPATVAGRKMHMSWQISTDNNGGLVTYHLYASDTYPVDITDAGNLLETYLTHTEYEYTPISPWRQKRYFAVTAADRFGNESAPLELNAISETDMPLLNDGDILTLPEIKEAKTVKIFTATGEEIKYFVYAPQMSIASLPGGFYTVYILNNAGAQTFVGTIVK